jgi:hypothetical protein
VRTIGVFVASVLLTLAGIASAQKVVSPPQVAPSPVPLQPPSPSATELGNPPQPEATLPQHQPDSDDRGTEQSPLIVKVLPPVQADGSTQQHAQERDDKATIDWWLAWFTGGLVLVGFLQLFVFGRQALRLRQSINLTRDIADRQELDMRASITEAGRAAGAMENVAASLAINSTLTKEILDTQQRFAKMQMRAYLSIINPGYIPQTRETEYRAEVQITIINTGHTPAHNLTFASRLRVLPFPLPPDFDFTITEDEYIASGHINPGQQLFFRRHLDDLLTDDELNEIMRGSAKKLFIYGTIIFKDVFGDDHRTNFCQWGVWDVTGRFSTMNTNRHNDAT